MTARDSSAAWGGDVATQAYERLRSEALGDSSSLGAGRGMALMMRKGMALWARAWRDVEQTASCTTHRKAPIVQHQLVVALLADLVVAATRNEEIACA